MNALKMAVLGALLLAGLIAAQSTPSDAVQESMRRHRRQRVNRQTQREEPTSAIVQVLSRYMFRPETYQDKALFVIEQLAANGNEVSRMLQERNVGALYDSLWHYTTRMRRIISGRLRNWRMVVNPLLLQVELRLLELDRAAFVQLQRRMVQLLALRNYQYVNDGHESTTEPSSRYGMGSVTPQRADLDYDDYDYGDYEDDEDERDAQPRDLGEADGATGGAAIDRLLSMDRREAEAGRPLHTEGRPRSRGHSADAAATMRSRGYSVASAMRVRSARARTSGHTEPASSPIWRKRVLVDEPAQNTLQRLVDICLWLIKFNIYLLVVTVAIVQMVNHAVRDAVAQHREQRQHREQQRQRQRRDEGSLASAMISALPYDNWQQMERVLLQLALIADGDLAGHHL